MNFPSKLVENAVNEISKLPGIGKKTALRLVLYLLKENEQETIDLAAAITHLRKDIHYCGQCHNISDAEVCQICSSHKRDSSVICLVENIQDVLAIENTSQFQGKYHVLGGIISPVSGIGPSELKIDSLIQRVYAEGSEIKEIIFALPSTMEGDTTAFYITKKLKDAGIKMSTIARGIPIGGELEYADEITLGRSILSRTLYEQ